MFRQHTFIHKIGHSCCSFTHAHTNYYAGSSKEALKAFRVKLSFPRPFVLAQLWGIHSSNRNTAGEQPGTTTQRIAAFASTKISSNGFYGYQNNAPSEIKLIENCIIHAKTPHKTFIFCPTFSGRFDVRLDEILLNLLLMFAALFALYQIQKPKCQQFE